MTSNRIFYQRASFGGHLYNFCMDVFYQFYIFMIIYVYVWGTPFDWLLVVCVAGWNQPESM